MDHKRFVEAFLNALPHGILCALVGLLLLVVALNGVNYAQFFEFLRISIWPAVVLVALLFFRRVFTYLFFSVEEFNFFGAKGGLKNVQEMIAEKAKEVRDTEREAEALERERLEYQQQIEEVRNSGTQAAGREEKALNLADRMFRDREIYRNKNRELQRQVDSLISQISTLHSQKGEFFITEPADIGEEDDVGRINPQIESSTKV